MTKFKFSKVIFIALITSLVACSNIAENDQEKNNLNDEINSGEHGNENKSNVHENKNELNGNENEKDEGEMNDPVNNDDQIIEEDPNIIEKMEDPSIAVLVNKQYHLGDHFIPADLVTVEVPTVLENPEVKQLRKVAADALYEMFEGAKEEGIYLHARSGYRSYQTQVQLFNNYKERHGEEAANRYSAKPGHSEHQTGLVMDVTSESVNYQLSEEFGETEEGKWLEEHAHEYGFIIRYPKGKEEITGYIYEPWHIRYLGVELATAVYESGLTYEEFLDREGILNEVNAEKVNAET